MTSTARRQALRGYLLECRDRLRLQAWDIDVSPHAAGPEDESSTPVLAVSIDERRHFANVKIGTFFTTDPDIVLTREEQRDAVAHELLHLTHAHLWWWLEHGPWPDIQMAPQDRSHTEEAIRGEIEQMVDFISRLVGPTLPAPPDWPE